jgi:predicted metal-dependent hydrolase
MEPCILSHEWYTIGQLMALPTYTLERSHRRSISLTISSDGKLIVKAPTLMPAFIINRFIKEKQDWIERRIALIEVNPVKAKKEFVNGEKFYFLGKLYELSVVSGTRTIELNEVLIVPNIPKILLKTELMMWYKTQAKKIILERVEIYKNKTGLTPTGVTISNARSKWGTCFHDNTMNFSWRLVMAPLSVIDYVVVHEFSHIQVKNHSRKFWERVKLYCPLYRTERRWLKTHGSMLDFSES